MIKERKGKAPRKAIELVKMVSLQRMRVASLSGHVAHFEPRQPALVHPDMVKDCMARGAVPADEAGIPLDVNEDNTRDRVTASGDLRSSLVMLLMMRFVKENDVKAFDSGGIPKLDVLNKTLGFDISPKERSDIWQALMTLRGAGEEPALHQDATQVLDILDAQSKAELLLIAKGLGIESSEVEGLNARDLRRHLLANYQGLTSA